MLSCRRFILLAVAVCASSVVLAESESQVKIVVREHHKVAHHDKSWVGDIYDKLKNKTVDVFDGDSSDVDSTDDKHKKVALHQKQDDESEDSEESEESAEDDKHKKAVRAHRKQDESEDSEESEEGVEDDKHKKAVRAHRKQDESEDSEESEESAEDDKHKKAIRAHRKQDESEDSEESEESAEDDKHKKAIRAHQKSWVGDVFESVKNKTVDVFDGDSSDVEVTDESTDLEGTIADDDASDETADDSTEENADDTTADESTDDESNEEEEDAEERKKYANLKKHVADVRSSALSKVNKQNKAAPKEQAVKATAFSTKETQSMDVASVAAIGSAIGAAVGCIMLALVMVVRRSRNTSTEALVLSDPEHVEVAPEGEDELASSEDALEAAVVEESV